MRILPIFLFVFSFAMNQLFAQEEDYRNIVNVANAGFLEYLERIPIGHEPLYGFNNRNEFRLVQVSKPYQIVTLNHEFFNDSADLSRDYKNYLLYTNEWKVPLILDAEYRIFVTVTQMNGEWRVVGIGSSPLAREISDFEKAHGLTQQYGCIMRIYQLRSDFLLIEPHAPETEILVYPLSSANISMGLPKDQRKPYILNQILSTIKLKLEKK